MKEKWGKLKKISKLAKEHSFLALCAFCILVCALVCLAFLVNSLFKTEYKWPVNEEYTVAQFSDEVFETALRKALQHPEGDIYEEDLFGMNELVIKDVPELSDISDIKLFPNLTSLTISGCSVYDVSPIASVTHLRSLYLPKNKVTDISALCELDYLEIVDLSSNNISQIPDGIVDLNRLLELYLPNNRIRSIGNVVDIETLQVLSLRGNRLTEIPVLGNMKSLKAADFGYNAIRTVASLEDTESLEILVLDGNCLVNLDFLKNQMSITELDISYNDIKDIIALSSCKNLEILKLYGVQDFDFTPLHELPKFSSIYLDQEFNRTGNVDFLLGHFRTGDRTTILYIVSERNSIKYFN